MERPTFETLPTPSTEMRARLSTMWVFVMLNMIFADILSFLSPGFLEDVGTGYAGGVQISDALLLGAAVVAELAIAMVVLSRYLSYRANRLANIVVALVTATYVVAGGSTAPHYMFFAAIEIVCCAAIVWFAWRWRPPVNTEVSHRAQ